MNENTVKNKLNDLYNYKIEREQMNRRFELEIISMLPVDMISKYNDAKAKYEQDLNDMNIIIDQCESEIKNDVKSLKQSVETEKMKATFVLGGEIWDSDALDELVKSLPILENYRKQKADSARIYVKKSK